MPAGITWVQLSGAWWCGAPPERCCQAGRERMMCTQTSMFDHPLVESEPTVECTRQALAVMSVPSLLRLRELPTERLMHVAPRPTLDLTLSGFQVGVKVEGLG